MRPCGSVKPCLGYVILTESKQVPFTDFAWPCSFSNNVKLNLCLQPPRFSALRHIYVWVWSCLSRFNLLGLMCFINPKRSSEIFFSLFVYCAGINLHNGVMNFPLHFLSVPFAFRSQLSFGIMFLFWCAVWVAFSTKKSFSYTITALWSLNFF